MSLPQTLLFVLSWSGGQRTVSDVTTWFASHLTELLIQLSVQLSLEHACHVSHRPKLTFMEKTCYNSNQPVSVRVGLWWALSSWRGEGCLLPVASRGVFSAHTLRERSLLPPPFLKRTPALLGEGPTLVLSVNLNYLPKGPNSNRVNVKG